jgi:hypothetical protein
VALQKADLRLVEIQRLRKELPETLERISGEIRGHQEAFRKMTEEFEALKLHRRRREKDLEVEMERVRKAKTRLFEVKTNKEYQAQLKEIELAEQANAGLEEEILLLMEEMDRRAGELKAREDAFHRTEAELSDRLEAVRSRLHGLEDQEATAQAERAGLAARMDEGLLSTYNRVARGNSGMAVVEVKGGTCQGCFLSIPPQLYNEILKSGPLIQCPFCTRFIYHQPQDS